MKLITASGREIEVYLVIKGQMIDYVHVYINTLDLSEAFQIFSNSDETQRITIFNKEDGSRRTYAGYTNLYAIQQPILSSPPGTWMVWLNRSYDEEVSENAEQ